KEQALKIILEIASALDAAWKQIGFIHRNLKPENVILSDDGAVKIINFGSATLVKSGDDPLAFDDGHMVGTPNYASPEQIECRRSIDFRSDIYGAGALLYQLITGMAPFAEEKDPMEVLSMQLNNVLPSPSDMEAEGEPVIELSVSRLIQRMMAKAPADRYGFWQDVIEDIQRILSGRPLFSETSGKYTAPASTIADPVNLARLLAAGKLNNKRPAGYIVSGAPKKITTLVPTATSPSSSQSAKAAAFSAATKFAAADSKKPAGKGARAPGPLAVLLGSLVVIASMWFGACMSVNKIENREKFLQRQNYAKLVSGINDILRESPDIKPAIRDLIESNKNSLAPHDAETCVRIWNRVNASAPFSDKLTREEMYKSAAIKNIAPSDLPLATTKILLAVSLGKHDDALALIEEYDLPELRVLVEN
ncbi:MAG: serine/threonine protein kinase, partial [Kiritimatiellaeota bacterium]|nr:serine/threonine protein kinase [Kiritimatiellota bacterium]